MEILHVSLVDLNRVEVLGKLFSRRRAELLREISRGGKTLGEIAKQTGTNRAFITESIQLFQSLGIVEIDRKGRAKVPRLATKEVRITLK